MPETDTILDALSIQIEEGATFGHPEPRSFLIEPPVLIRPGTYDIDFIGAFSFMGGRRTELRHVAMIGRFCSIAYNIMAGVEEHPHDFLSPNPMFQGAFDWKQAVEFREENAAILSASSHVWWSRRDTQFDKIVIGSDVWIGEGALIRRGITIGDGAIIAARSVVTRDVPAYAIVAGSPAKLLRYRFEQPVIEALLKLNWWSYGLTALHGVDLSNINQAIDRIDANIASGRARLYESPIVRIEENGDAVPFTYDADSNERHPADISDPGAE